MNAQAFHRRCLRIKAIGCLACRKRGWWSFPEVHHLNEDGKAGQARRGDEYTIGLCIYHHQGKVLGRFTLKFLRRRLGPSLKNESKEFRETFGSDDALLAEQNELIAEQEDLVVGRTALIFNH